MEKYFRAGTLCTGLLSCGGGQITSGTIDKKLREPEHTYTVTEENFWTGEEIKTKYIDDEDFIIVLQQFGGTKFKSTRQRQLYVSKTAYDSLNVGDFVDLQASRIKYEDDDPDLQEK